MSTDLFGPATAPNAVTVRPSENRTFAGTDTFFKDCSSPTANDGTEIQAAFLNELLANARTLARGNGNLGSSSPVVAEDNTDDALLLKSVQQLIQRGQVLYATDTGTADAMVAAFSPAIAEYKAGMVVRIKKSANANATTTPTATLNGLGTKTIVKRDGSALAPGDLIASGVLDYLYDGTNLRVLSFLASDISVLIGQVGSTYVEYNSGSSNFTVPAGVFWLQDLQIVAGGGGAGGAASGDHAGGGGNGGITVRCPRVAVTPGQVIAYVVGAGGTAGSAGGGSDGGDGGTSSFGSFLARPGKGGLANGAAGSAWASGSAGTIISSGQQGRGGQVFVPGSLQVGGNGGGSFAGGLGGGGATNGNTGGNPGTEPGGAGGGGSNGTAGGIGAAGRISFRY